MWTKRRIVWFVLIIAIMFVIFYFSSQNGERSGAVGNAVAKKINITSSGTVDESHMKLMFGLDLRKWAHIGLYAALGFMAYGWTLSMPKATIICLIYAILDELHQMYVPGRNAKVSDILIDAVGFLILIGITDWVRKMFVRLMKNRG